jgi:hypothetical protein
VILLFLQNHTISGGSNTLNSIDTRLEEFETAEKISSVFEQISPHKPVKIKEKIGMVNL